MIQTGSFSHDESSNSWRPIWFENLPCYLRAKYDWEKSVEQINMLMAEEEEYLTLELLGWDCWPHRD